MYLLAAVLFGGLPCRAQDAEGDPFADLVRRAYAANPSMEAAYERWQAALERVPQARALPDPTITYGYFVQRMTTRQQLRVEQMLPAFGKRSAAGAAAEAAADLAATQLETVAADVRLAVLEAAAGYVLAIRSTALVEDNLRLVENLLGVARQRYRAGGTSQADVLRLESEADTLRNELQAWREREPAARARINALLARPALTELPALNGLPPLPPNIPEPPPDFQVGLEDNPEMREASAGIREARAAQIVARRESRPDLMVGIDYMDNRADAPDEVMGMISVNIPVWQGRYRAARREAAAELRAARAEYAARRHRIEGESRMLHFELRDAFRRLRLVEDSLLPRAQQTLAILEAAYRTGSTGFLELLDAQRTVLDLELNALRAHADAFIRMAEWERLTAAARLPLNDQLDPSWRTNQ